MSTKENAPTGGTVKASDLETPLLNKESDMNITTTSSVSVVPDLQVIEGHVTTTSQQVADHFGKRHADVIRAIRNLEIPAEFHQRNFAPMFLEVEIGRGATRKDPAYRITRDGFTLLAMGFTGKEAMHWKIAYLNAFNKMEAALLQTSQTAIGYTRINPAQAQTLKEHVQRIVEAGLQTFGETWGRLHKKFRVNSYLELSTGQFEEACRYLEQKLPRQYHFPLNTADPHDRQFANANLAPSVLLDPKNRAPELELIAQLEKDGYDVMGAKMRIFAMRDAMEYLENYRNNMAHMYEKLKPLVDICKNGMRENGKNVKFVGKVNPANAIDRLVFGDQM